jgi:hypothetical protein
MPDWSIKFVPVQNPTPEKRADFQLDSPKGKRRAAVQVFSGDIVSWNNTTQDDHQPAVFDPVDGAGPPAGSPQPVGGTLKPHKSSPGYGVSASPGSTIRFCCTLHKGEFGILVVVEPGQTPGPPPSAAPRRSSRGAKRRSTAGQFDRDHRSPAT